MRKEKIREEKNYEEEYIKRWKVVNFLYFTTCTITLLGIIATVVLEYLAFFEVISSFMLCGLVGWISLIMILVTAILFGIKHNFEALYYGIDYQQVKQRLELEKEAAYTVGYAAGEGNALLLQELRNSKLKGEDYAEERADTKI